MDWEDALLWIGGVLLVLMMAMMIIGLIIALIHLPISIKTERACIAAGYADYTVVWWLDPYCIEWTEANQRSVPLEEVLNGRRP